jgi:putative ABC transport system permease protein
MSKLSVLFRKLGILFGRDRYRRELEEEMRFHRTEAERSFAEAGISAEHARRAAARQFGNITLLKQRSLEAISFRFETVLQDLNYALRQMRKSPGFTALILLTLALGIGACTAVFSLVNAVLLRSLPYGDPGSLVYLYTPNPNIPIPAEVLAPGYADFADLKRQSQSFANMTAFAQATFSISAQSSVDRIGAARVDSNFFNTLQSAPLLGRTITSDDTQSGHDKVAVISHALWQSMFNGDADILTRSVQLDGVNYRIVGVMKPAFAYPQFSDLPYGTASIKATQVWLPLALTPQQRTSREPGDNNAIARLKPGVSLQQAQAEMSAIMSRLDKLHTGVFRGSGALIEHFLDTAIGPVQRLMWILFGAVCLVLLIACGNAANLLLARATNRMRELSVRAALGAGRGRIVRQLLSESLLIGSAASLLGIGLAWLFLRALPLLDPGNIPRLNTASLDLRVLAFTLIVAFGTSVLTGILPALAVSKLGLNNFLSSGNSRSVAGGHSRSQSALIIAETALVVVLLACAGLLLRSYINVQSVDTGFSQGTVTMTLWPEARYRNQQADRSPYFKPLLDKVRALPGVTAAGAVSNLPLSNTESVGFFQVEGYPNVDGQLVEGRSVTPQYFSAMSIPLIAGRGFTDSDANYGTQPTIVNQRFVQAYLGHRNPIGARISTDDDHKQWNTIIGVVADVRHSNLEEQPKPQVYHANFDFGEASLAIRSTLPAHTIVDEVRSALKAAAPNLAITDIHTMGDLVSEASAQRRFQTSLLAVFAGMALLLALVGIYGLMAYSVTRRTQEMGIRMALGAQRNDVVLLMLRNAASLLGIGLVIGLACAWAATHAIRSFLFGLSEHDPITIVAVCAVLAIGGFAAAYLPARRASSIDPMQALRAE